MTREEALDSTKANVENENLVPVRPSVRAACVFRS